MSNFKDRPFDYMWLFAERKREEAKQIEMEAALATFKDYMEKNPEIDSLSVSCYYDYDDEGSYNWSCEVYEHEDNEGWGEGKLWEIFHHIPPEILRDLFNLEQDSMTTLTRDQINKHTIKALNYG